MSPDDEYAAYSAVIAEFGAAEPYVAIRAAELCHVEALARQLERHGVAVPDTPYPGEMAAPDDLATAATAWADREVVTTEPRGVVGREMILGVLLAALDWGAIAGSNRNARVLE